MFKATHKRRATTLPKTLLTAGLLGAAALTTLGAGSAKAATGCGIEIDWLAWIGGQSLTCEDKEFTWQKTDFLGDLGSGVVSALKFPGDIYLFNLDKAFSDISYDFTYEVKVTKPGYYIDAVDFDTDAVPLSAPPSIATAEYSFNGAPDPDITLASTNGSSSAMLTGSQPTTITVRNSYGSPITGTGDGAIDTLENSFRQQVPAPLPLLGVGAVFGSIRKLRKFSSQLKTFSMA